MVDYKKYSKQLYLFFSISFIFTWVFWLPDALAKRGLLPDNIFTNLGFIGAFGPLFSAILLTLIYEGKDGLKKLLKRGVDSKIGFKWLLVVFVFLPFLVAIAFFIGVTLDAFLIPEIPDLLIIFFAFFSILILSGPLEEEFGWRGYALPRLQEKYNSFISTIILGLLWAFWHLPQFIVPIELTGMFYKTPILTFIPTVVAASFIFTWVYNNTDGSIFAQLILHTTYNLSMWYLPVLDTTYGYLIILVVFLVAAVFIVVFGFKNNQEKTDED